MSLTQQDVVRAALEVLDESGLPGLTFRRLADRLGVRAPTLYWHVRDKHHLLDLMAEAIIGSAGRSPRPEPGQSFWAWMAGRARGMRSALLAHPDGALVAAGNRPTLAALPGIEELLGEFVAVGFTPGEALRAIFALSAFVIGDAIETQSEQVDGGIRRPGPGVAEVVTSGELPLLSEATHSLRACERPLDERFEFGLSLLLDGLRQRLADRTGLSH